MEVEIGSVFPLNTLKEEASSIIDKDKLMEYLGISDNSLFLSLGREAFSIVARKHPEIKKVLFPRYTCQTVCDPFIQLGWNFETYVIDKNLRINIDYFKKIISSFQPAIVVVHPFYGTSFTLKEIEAIKEAKNRGIIIVVDYTQSIYYSNHLDFADYIVASLRKWFDCPDGGYIYSKSHDLSDYSKLSEHSDFVIPQIDSMYLREVYFKTNNQSLKDISIRLNKQAVMTADFNIQPHALSKFGLNRLLNASVQDFAKVRYSNFKYLYGHLNQSSKIKFVYVGLADIVSAPLYFPIYCENREKLQRLLAVSKIYAPVLWPVPKYYTYLDEESRYIYEHILVIPVDQRYGVEEMKRICDVINKF